ncbi:MAG: trigger factor [Candidatus Sungbacteria bacterium RIFCSPHIGHO2_02_FULL_52_23]|uniref:Trigger factor n=1 Tax=Candidatus Sungbacteria bacterium RIFCSPHIGHO2_02_FULL_52_23 TaxID=1802274 RepID=A0A1G2KVB8_9BACT|nr:MAG: trigger factor [Candidatus Sungbacteria bacterium RIFCSPHIGHO2_02_FULL_52_23]
MDASLTTLPGSEVEIRVVIPFPEFEPHLKTAATAISEEITVEGFRKGKAPYDVVKNRVGENAIYERAAEIAVRKTYPKARDILLEQGKLSPEHPAIGRPEVTISKLAPGNELTYTIKVALMPAVTLPDWRAIAKSATGEKKAQTVSDEEVDKTLAWLAESRMKLVAVARAAQKDDHAEIDLEIRHDGVKIAEGDSKNHPLVIGKGKFLPGFEDELVGMEAGGRKTFSLVAPPDWRDATVAGKTLEFSVIMKSIQERMIPTVDDEFARGLGAFPNVEALKANIREGLLTEKGEKEVQRIRGLTIAEIAKKATMEVPEVLIASEIGKMAAELKAGVADLGMQWEDYLLHIKKSEADLKKDWRDEAKNRVRSALVLREIARKEQINPTEDEIKERADQFLKQFENGGEAGHAIDPRELHDYTQGVLRNEKVFELLENI